MDGAIRTQVNFVAGFDAASRVPPAVRKAGLTHRTAVIQETYRPDSPDMYFDEALWLRLLDFARAFCPGAEVLVGKEAQTPEAFLQDWRASDERDPADSIEVRNQGELVLFVATEFWTNVGGPAPYADSYTYSFFSKDEITGRLMAYLRDGDTDRRWMLASEAMPAAPEKGKHRG
jgi:hypothetical protein